MAKAIFTTKVNPNYDDLPDLYHHFPKVYLKRVERTLGDQIIYYEPRRQDQRDSGQGGRQAYFAVATVERIEPDQRTPDHFYAHVRDYLEDLVILPMPADIFLAATDLYRSLRKKGVTIPQSVDCMIAAVAIEHAVPLLHNDRDFAHIARHSRLRVV